MMLNGLVEHMLTDRFPSATVGCAANVEAESSARPVDVPMTSHMLRVLIVEDSASDAGLLLRHLERGGYVLEHEIVDSADGMRAALATKSWDLVIADYVLPQFDAPAALEVLRASNQDIPFI